MTTKDSIIIPGEIIISEISFRDRLKKTKALLFDWDGIFNDGQKGIDSSSFNEIDSMGINMLRFGYYLHHGSLPICVIVTGEKNDTAIKWAEREHFHAVYMKVKNKSDVLESLEMEHGLSHEEMLFVFDDIHDLALAKKTGCGILVKNKGAEMFRRYCAEHRLCDYITHNSGGSYALREISEVILSLLGLYNRTVEARIEFNGIYQDYFQMRNQITTHIQVLKY